MGDIIELLSKCNNNLNSTQLKRNKFKEKNEFNNQG